MQRIVIFVLTVFTCSSCSNHAETKKNPAELAIPPSIENPYDSARYSSRHITFGSIKVLADYFRQKHDQLSKQRTAAYQRKDPMPPDSLQLIDAAINNLQAERNARIIHFIKISPKNAATIEGIKFLIVDRNVPVSLTDSLYNLFPAEIRNSGEGKWLFSMIGKRKETDLKAFYDISILDIPLQTPTGATATIKKTAPGIILLDFWASWCTPCRYENRVLVEKNIAANKKLTVIAISLDTDKNKWLKAMKEDGLNYPSLCDTRAMESPLVKAFALQTIPYNVLLDRNGKILATNLWGEKLALFITTL